MTENGDGVKLGRRPKDDRGEIVRNNGFTERQWEWFQKEAATKSMDTMTYIRMYPAQWWIDSVEASRIGSVATPEEDEEFNKLISNKKKVSKRNHKSKRSK